MCVGGDSGDASLLELSNSLVTCTKAEKVGTNVQAENAQRAIVTLLKRDLGFADC